MPGSGNVAILKGGKESARTAAVLACAIQAALLRTALPPTFVQTVETGAEVAALLAQDRYIDLVIPRGSNVLVRTIQHSTRIPVMGHADASVQFTSTKQRIARRRSALFSTPRCARALVGGSYGLVTDGSSAQIDYPAACNAVETLLVHESLLRTIWPDVARMLLATDVRLLCDEPTLCTGFRRHRQLRNTRVAGAAGRLHYRAPLAETLRAHRTVAHCRNRTHQRARLAPHGLHRDGVRCVGQRIYTRCQLGRRIRTREHPLRRWLSLWLWC